MTTKEIIGYICLIPMVLFVLVIIIGNVYSLIITCIDLWKTERNLYIPLIIIICISFIVGIFLLARSFAGS